MGWCGMSEYRGIVFKGDYSTLEITLHNNGAMDIEAEGYDGTVLNTLTSKQVRELIQWYRKSSTELYLGA